MSDAERIEQADVRRSGHGADHNIRKSPTWETKDGTKHKSRYYHENSRWERRGGDYGVTKDIERVIFYARSYKEVTPESRNIYLRGFHDAAHFAIDAIDSYNQFVGSEIYKRERYYMSMVLHYLDAASCFDPEWDGEHQKAWKNMMQYMCDYLWLWFPEYEKDDKHE